MRVIAIVTLLVSLFVVFFGFTAISQATLGVGILAAGVWLAVIGRIAQASAQHEDVMNALRKRDAPASPSVASPAATQPTPVQNPVQPAEAASH